MSGLNWQGETGPWDSGHGQGHAVVRAPALALFIATGLRTAAVGSAVVATSPDGVVWTPHAVATAPALSTWYGVAWSDFLPLAVAVGVDNNTGPPTSNAIWTSPDGVTWTPRGNPLDAAAIPLCVCLAPGPGLFVLGTDDDLFVGSSRRIATSSDGISWTNQTSPWDDANQSRVSSIAYSESLGVYVAGGVKFSAPATSPIACIMTSPDAITWTTQTTPFDGGAVYNVAWVDALNAFVAQGNDSGFTKCVMSSPDGVTWTAATTPMDGTTMHGGLCDAAGLVVAGGHDNHILSTSPDLVAWDEQNTTGFDSFGLCYAADLDVVVAVGESSSHSIYLSVPAVLTTAATPGNCVGGATLTGDVSPGTPGGGEVTWFFEWGPTTGYGFVTPGGMVTGLDTDALTDRTNSGTISSGSTYHYRIVAQHNTVEIDGADATFVGADCPTGPTVNTHFELGASVGIPPFF